MSSDFQPDVGGIAVIAMACRFPSADSPEAFWRNLCAGAEAVRFFTDEELLAAGIEPELFGRPDYVRANAVLDDIDLFDADLFGLTPNEAAVMDPQQRLFLECAWEALERGGCLGVGEERRISVFAGGAESDYLLENLFSNPELLQRLGGLQVSLLNRSAYLSPQVAYRLNLTGVAAVVQSACATSLLALHLACQSLLSGESEIALAGGVKIDAQQITGYLYEEGGVLSPDGHCRAFDASAQGTVTGSGAGVVLLKPLEDALRDGDSIQCVIRATAAGNDGGARLSFTAPTVRGQMDVIAECLELAQISAHRVGYVEAHGSGTPLGDPIEIEALRTVFDQRAPNSYSCFVGSVKTNLGHMDEAAGVAGLIKAALAVEHGLIPPTLHYRQPNPGIDFGSGLQVSTGLTPWPETEGRRVAGVSSFALGGTNVHVLLEEAPAVTADPCPRSCHALPLSAASPAALGRMMQRLADHLEAEPAVDLADVAYSLQTGRRSFAHRRVVVASDPQAAAQALREPGPGMLEGVAAGGEVGVAWLFPGLGDHRPGMLRELYAAEPVLRREVDRCCELLQPLLGVDLRRPLVEAERAPGWGETQNLRSLLHRDGVPKLGELESTLLAQPAVFVIEFALAQLLLSWGFRPRALLGHSLGEYVAATIAGVLSLESALRLVAGRARLIDDLPPGRMIAVPMSAESARSCLEGGLDLAAHDGPELSVIAGPPDEIEALAQRLDGEGYASVGLATTHAFHSAMMEPAIEPLRRLLAGVELRPPSIPWISGYTGRWVRAAEATDPEYWLRHLTGTVRFADGLATLQETLQEEGAGALLEVGPGSYLTTLVRQSAAGRRTVAVAALEDSGELGRPGEGAEARRMAAALGQLWCAGVEIPWRGLYTGRRRRLPLPTYPFERRRHWVTAKQSSPADEALGGAETSAPSVGEAPSAAETLALDGPVAEETLLAQLAEIWQELFGIESIDPDQSFFELGGHSLLAIQVVTRIRSRFDVELPMTALFEAPTVRGLAERLRQAPEPEPVTAATGSDSAADLPMPMTIPRRHCGHRCPASPDQERLWFMHQLNPHHHAYHIDHPVRVQGQLSLEALDRSVQEIVRRHEAWRTTFEEENGLPVQVIAPQLDLPFPIVDLRHLEKQDWEREAYELVGRSIRLPIDVEKGPLVRTGMVWLEDREWVFLLTVHHLVVDWLSLGRFWQELWALHQAFLAGEPSPLPELSIQFADYSEWLRRWLAENQQGLLEYWLQHLEGAPLVLELPPDRPRPRVQTTVGSRVALRFDRQLSDSLRRLSSAENATVFMVLTAVFQELLRRHCGQSRILLGTPSSNRDHIELEPMLGFFLNQLVLCTDLSGDPTFLELVGRTREVALGAYRHQDLPFSLLVEALQPKRDPSRQPVVQVVFFMLELKDEPMQGFEIEGLDLAGDTARWDLRMLLHDHVDGFVGWMEYNTDLYDATTILRLGESFKALAARAAADPEVCLSGLSAFTDGQRHQLLVENNAPEAAATAIPVHRDVAVQARRRPRAAALVHGEEELSYEQLVQRAQAAARELRRRGVGPEVLVGICIERSPELVLAALAVLYAGGAYVPLDPTWPERRRAEISQRSGVALVLSREALVPQSAGAIPWVVWSTVEAIGSRLSAVPDKSSWGGSVDPDQLAYAIYTSGSTGEPKGVLVSHRALANLIASMRRRPGLRDSEAFLAVTPFTFDIAALELLLPLTTGARLVLAGREEAADPQRLAGLMESSGATAMQATPATWRMLLDSGWRGRPGLKALSGGEALAAELAESLESRVGELWNLYGPTETTIWSATARVALGAPVSLGAPVAATRLYVLGADGEAVPAGVPGQLFIGGDGLARGYLGRPALTARFFLPDPWSAVSGARLYRTGDLVRRRGDGTLEFLGRVDRQLKLRAFRIEPAEIEAALEALEGIRQALVTAHYGSSGEASLVAYVLPGPAYGGSSGELRAALQQRLPEYLIPQRFVLLEEFPLTAHGKVDHAALPALELGQRRPGAGSRRARTDLETLLKEIWAQILAVPEVGVDEDFFELGGHSLLASRALSAMRQALGVVLPMSLFFEKSTIAAMMPVVEGTLRSQRGITLPPIEPQSSGDPAPLSFTQRWLWRREQEHPADPAYNLQVGLAFETLRVDLLEISLEALTHRQEILRTYFPSRGGEVRQRIAPVRAIHLNVRDLSGLPVAARDREAQAWLEQEVRERFDPAAAPPVRFSLALLAPGRWLLAVTIHMILCDAWSLDLLETELRGLYGAALEGRPAALPELPISYTDFARWQRQRREDGDFEPHRAYWRRRLEGAVVSRLPTDRRPPASGPLRGAGRCLALEAPLVSALRLLARGAATTPFMVHAAALATLLARSTRSADVLVGTTVAGRHHPRTEGLAGPLASTVVLRVPVQEDTSFRGLLERVRHLVLEAQMHQDWPLEAWPLEGQTVEGQTVEGQTVEGRFGNDSSKSGAEPFQVLFYSEPASSEAPSPMAAPGEPEPAEASTAKRELTLRIEEHPAGSLLDFQYAADCFDAATIARLAHRYRRLLTVVEEQPDAPLWRLSLLSAAELHQLLVEGAENADLAALAGGPEGLPVSTTPEPVAVPTPRDPEASPEPFALLGLERAALHDLQHQVGAVLAAAGDGSDPVTAEEARARIDDMYPLTPGQEGILYHTVADHRGGAYLTQSIYELRGELRSETLRRAAQRLVARHEILRSAFFWEQQDRPFQVVLRQAELPWRLTDWSALSIADQEAQLAAFLAADRRRGIELARPPLMRLALFRLADHRWLLVWSHHHLLLDGWSLGLLMDELVQIHVAEAQGQSPPSSSRPPFRDYIAWLGRRDGDAARAHWRDALRGFHRPTTFAGVERESSPEEESRSSGTPQQLVRRLSASGTEALQGFARRNRVTLNTLLQGAWALIVGAYSGSREVVFGSTVSGRPLDLDGAEEMIGIFINTLPVRVDLAPHQRLSSWLQALQSEQSRARDYDFAPLVEIQASSELPPGEVLFDSILVFESFPLEEILTHRGEALELVSARSQGETSYPLVLGLDWGEQLEMTLAYDRRRHRQVTVARILDHLETLLAAFVAESRQTLGRLPTVGREELERLRPVAQEPQLSQPVSVAVVELFEAQAAGNPQAPALIFEQDRWNFDDLNRRANQLARFLRSLGIGAGSAVALRMENPWQRVVGLLAVLKAGGAYGILDAGVAQAEVPMLLRAARVSCLLTDAETPAVSTGNGGGTGELQVIALPVVWERVVALGADDLAVPVTASDPAHWTMVRSGDGGPVVQVFDHAALAQAVGSLQQCLGSAESGQLAVAAIGSEPWSPASLFSCWGAGGSLCLSPYGDDLDAEALVSTLSSLPVASETHHLSASPDVLEALLDAGLVASVPALSTLVADGGACGGSLAGDLSGQASGCRVLRVFRPAGDALPALFYELPRELASHGASGASSRELDFGAPLAGTVAYVLDAGWRPVPRGAAGEIFLGGSSWAGSSWGDPRTTARSFVPDPFASSPGGRLWRTGTRGRWTVEGRLGPPPAVDQPGTGLQRGAWREDAVMAPRTPLEEELVEIWRELLGVEAVSVDRGFFELGGHSLRAMQTITRIRRRWRIELSLLDLLGSPTIRQLAEVIGERLDSVEAGRLE